MIFEAPLVERRSICENPCPYGFYGGDDASNKPGQPKAPAPFGEFTEIFRLDHAKFDDQANRMVAVHEVSIPCYTSGVGGDGAPDWSMVDLNAPMRTERLLNREHLEDSMAAMVLPAHRQPKDHADALLQVSVHLHATVMAPNAARHKANVWLSMIAGHLLLAENPELVLDDPLCWRFDVVRSLPRRMKPGTVQRNIVGRMLVVAETGEIVDSETLVEELTSSADALAVHAA